MIGENTYRVAKHFGAPGWLTAIWNDLRRMNGCVTIPCDCVWCGMMIDAINAEDKLNE